MYLCWALYLYAPTVSRHSGVNYLHYVELQIYAMCYLRDTNKSVFSFGFSLVYSLVKHSMPVSHIPWCHPYTNAPILYPIPPPQPVSLPPWLESEQKVSVSDGSISVYINPMKSAGAMCLQARLN